MKSIAVLVIVPWVVPLPEARPSYDEPSNPNVILILADDLGYGEIQALNPGRAKIPTPCLDRLAGEGMVFTDAHTTSSVCTPSRYSLLTGRYNWRSRHQSGVVQGGDEPLIPEGRMTLGHLFQGQGYHTAIVGKWHLNYRYEVPEELKGESGAERSPGRPTAGVPVGTRIPDGPLTRGFDSFYGFHHSASMSSLVRDDEIVEEVDVVEMLPRLTARAVRIIDERAQEAKEGKPFFLYYAMSSPHTPIAPAAAWQGRGKLGTYADFVAQTDGSVGEIMGALERHGLEDNTIVIFSSDNGTSRAARIRKLEQQGHFPSGGLRGSKADLWDGGHRVPFLVRWPGSVKAGSSSAQLISLMDLMAGFAEFFGVEFNDVTAEDSLSFWPALLGKEVAAPRETLIHHSIHGRFAIRHDRWKLLLAPGSGGWSAPTDLKASAEGLPELQLYDLGKDLGESTNLIAKHPDVVDSLVARLEECVSRGRTTAGEDQSNDVPVDVWKEHLNEPKK